MIHLLSYITWNPEPVALTIGNFNLYWYGIMWGLSVLLGYLLCLHLFKQQQLPTNKLANLVEHIFIGGLIGARIGYILLYDLHYFLTNPLLLFDLRSGGLASHGGVLGILAAVYWYSRKHPNISYLKLLDILSLGSLLVGGLIRIGNLMNSEIVGKATTLPWGFIFVQRGEDFARHPSQVYDILLVFTLLLALYYLYHKKWQQWPVGLLTGLFFALAFSGRTCLEFFKTDASLTQYYNLLPIALGIGLIVFACQRFGIASD